MKNLTQGNIYKNFILFALPLVFSAFLSQGYNLIDNIIAGKYLGDIGLAATGATSPFISFCSSLFWGFSVGSSIYIAMLFGAEDYQDIKSGLFYSTMILISVSFLFCLVVIIWGNNILHLLKVDPSIHHAAKTYLYIYMCGFFVILLNNHFVQSLYSLGISTYPFVVSIVSALLNIFGNVFAIKVLHLGVAGIALATVFSALIVDILYLHKFKKCFTELEISKTKLRWNTGAIKKISHFAIPCTFQQSIMYTANLFISPIINGIGSAASASYTVVLRIYEINACVYQNSAKTVSTYTAQSIGAGEPDNLKKGVAVGFLQGILFLSVPLLICVLLAKPVCSMFFPKGYSGESLDISLVFARYFLPFIIFNVVNNLFHSFYRGIGSSKFLITLTALGSISRTVLTFVLANIYGMNGVFVAWVLSWILEAVVALAIYFSGIWKKHIINPFDSM